MFPKEPTPVPLYPLATLTVGRLWQAIHYRFASALRHMSNVICLLAPLLFPIIGSLQGVDPKVVAKIEERCQTELDLVHSRSDFPGGSLALILPGGQSLAITVGTTDKERDGQDLKASDRLLSGSIGKTYVAAMALKLSSEGKLDLDAKAIDFFEGESWFLRLAGSDSFTVRQLLRHQSGLQRYVFGKEFWETLTQEIDKVWEPKELLSFVFDHDGLFAPGEGWAYSDTNYIVVGMILEKISGEKMYDYVQNHFLDPHKLRDTVPSDSRRIPGLIQGHTRSFQAFGLPDRVLDEGLFIINPQFEWCGGGFCNTPLDLARWARILFSGAAFDADYLPELLASVPADPRQLGSNSSYGPGCIIRQTELGELRGHDGVMTGYQSVMGWYPDLDLAIAFQMNMDSDRKIGMPLSRLLMSFAKIAAEEL
ncbi:MAG: D-alanyl-D-alanine carboxypeptidase, partial [Candidatus Paceibacteria bacterium]